MAKQDSSYALTLGLIFAIVVIFVVIGIAASLSSDLDAAEKRYKDKDKQFKNLDDEKLKLIAEREELRQVIHGSTDKVDVAKVKKSYLEEGSRLLPDILKEEKLLQEDPFTKALEESGLKEGKTYTYFTDMHKDLMAEVKCLIAVLPRLRIERDAAFVDVEAARSEKKDLEDKLQKEIASLRTKLTAEQDRALQREREFDKEKKRLEDEIGTVKQQIAKNEREYQIKESILENKVRELQDRITDLVKKEEKSKQDLEADGEVVLADPELGYAWVNIGRRDGLRKGFKFEVFQFLKGGAKQLKGFVEVKKVEEDMSQVAIISTIDTNDPVIKGDLIRSPFFDKKEKQIFVLLGQETTNTLYGKKDLVKKIEEFGGQVAQSITIETDFVILLKKGEEEPEFDKAIQFGIIILKESELLEFLGP